MIIDASFAAKWYIVEEYTRYAQDLLDEKNRLLAPEIFRVEVFNAIVKAKRANRINVDYAIKAIENFKKTLETGIVRITSDLSLSLIDHAVEIALAHGHHVQDCIYVALAKREKQGLVTSDNNQADIAESLGVNVLRYA